VGWRRNAWLCLDCIGEKQLRFVISTTVHVTRKRQVILPKEYCEQKHIEPGTTVRITAIGEGLYLSPIPPPTETELRKVFKAAGAAGPERITSKDERLMTESIRAVRARRSRPSRFRILAASGNAKRALRILDKLDRALGSKGK